MLFSLNNVPGRQEILVILFFQVFQDEFWDNPASRQSDCQQDEVKYQQMSRRKLLDDADVEFPESMATSDYIKSIRQISN